MVKERFYKTEVVPRCLTFKRPAGTSRGVYTTRKLWEVRIRKEDEPSVIGIGECAPLPDLSCDYGVDYEITLSKACLDLEQKGHVDTESLRHYPSILFGLETAMRHYEQGGWRHYDTPFSQGQAGIPINGLIWMGDYKYMLEQVEEKMKEGFRCVKLKIGAIDFDRELSLLKHIRAHFSAKEIELRVDANGAFTPSEAMDKLKRLAEMDLHSIEQPIRAGQWEDMARLTAETPLPIALDEELIGINIPERKQCLLDSVHPQYIILKPSLHGGMAGGNEWIREAEKRNIPGKKMHPEAQTNVPSHLSRAPAIAAVRPAPVHRTRYPALRATRGRRPSGHTAHSRGSTLPRERTAADR